MTAFAHGMRIGKYEIRDKLGHGGYGIVYAARDTELGRDLAMKFLRQDYVTKPQVMQRFLQEARSAAKIVHPGIVTVYEAGHVEGTGTSADGTIYIAMELLTGEDLSTRLDAGAVSIEKTLELGIQIAAALEAAHNRGVVHRDLKPDNIFLVPDSSVPGGERVKILDFGIAKLADSDRAPTTADGATGVHTHSMMMLGTPRYMSPEQCKSSARVDHRSDIYTLGCILFELLSDHSPFDGDGGELIAKHQLAPIPRVRSVRPEVPAFLDVLISTMLAKDPGDRPPTMERVREALVACAQGTAWSGSTQAELAAAPDTTMRGSAGSTTTGPRSHLPSASWLAAGVATVALGITIGIWVVGLTRDRGAPPPAPVPVVAPAPVAIAAVDDHGAKEQECRSLAADRRWDDLLHCADQLARALPAGSPVVRELTTMGVIEARNAMVSGKVDDAVKQRDLTEAYRWLDRIDDESVYKEESSDHVDHLAATMPQAVTRSGPACNADKLASRAQEAITQGLYMSALALLEGSLRCRPDASLYRLALLAACNSGNAVKAKRYFAKLPAGQQTAMTQLCIRNKITLP